MWRKRRRHGLAGLEGCIHGACANLSCGDGLGRGDGNKGAVEYTAELKGSWSASGLADGPDGLGQRIPPVEGGHDRGNRLRDALVVLHWSVCVCVCVDSSAVALEALRAGDSGQVSRLILKNQEHRNGPSTQEGARATASTKTHFLG